MKKIWILAAIPVVALSVLLISNMSNRPPPGDADLTREQLSGLPACGSGMEFYNVSPIAAGDYARITPLGNMNPPNSHVFPADHMYIHIRTTDPNDKKSDSIEVPVYSPGDVWLLRVDKVEAYSPVAYTDYTLFFAPCSELAGEYHHMTTISKKISENLGSPAFCIRRPEETYCVYDIEVKLSSGELIGTAGGNPQKGRELDLQAYDFRAEEAGFANKARFSESRLHMVCPLDYFTEPLKSELYSRIGMMGSQGTDRTNESLCGEFAQDRVGTLQGGWLKKGKDLVNNEDYELALVHDNVEQDAPIMSFGREALPFMEGGLLTYGKQESGFVNRDFSEVTNDGNIYCFEQLRDRYGEQSIDFSLLMQLTGEASIRVAKINSASCGAGPWAMPSDAVEFER